MKISLIHPSRGRPDKARQTRKDWFFNLTNGDYEIEHILSLDFSDTCVSKYESLFKFLADTKIIIGTNDNVVEATNRAAKMATGDILVYLSDDFKCPLNWDKSIVEWFKDITSPRLLKVDDCYQAMDKDVLTIPIMNRRLYERLGYFFHPGYKSMWVDCDLYHVVKNNNWLKIAPELKFPHEHHVNGFCNNDETYQRSNLNWETGKKLYIERKIKGFQL